MTAAGSAIFLAGTEAQAQCHSGRPMQRPQATGMMYQTHAPHNHMMMSAGSQQRVFASSALQRHHEANLAIDRQQRLLFQQLNAPANKASQQKRSAPSPSTPEHQH